MQCCKVITIALETIIELETSLKSLIGFKTRFRLSCPTLTKKTKNCDSSKIETYLIYNIWLNIIAYYVTKLLMWQI